MSAAGRIVGQVWFQHTFRTEKWSNLSALHISERKRLNDPVRCANGSRKTKTRKQFTQSRTKRINFLRDKENSTVRQERSVFVRVKCEVSMSRPWRYIGGKGKSKGKIHIITGHEGAEGEQRHSSTLSLTSALDGVGGQRHAPAALPPGKWPGTHCIEGYVGPTAGLDGCGKSRPHRDSIPGTSSPLQVAIPTEVSRPTGI